MRASGSSAPLPRGPATTNVPPSSPLASMPRENVQHIHPQEHELNDDDKQGSSKNENGTSENNKKDIADLY